MVLARSASNLRLFRLRSIDLLYGIFSARFSSEVARP
jgi:hypothetical protein